ncbi:hypothetical protein ARMGADRAFT_1171026 [Armillaria gallica]|uniref:Uncharacterized protein n=1 Tax=Armillaria gallica TaxID=47427 RepID=A0A2H3CT01_ARMGA|nr:hypothetical protein ARMGADRAFT_1171026 [Armillaria gallica]
MPPVYGIRDGYGTVYGIRSKPVLYLRGPFAIRLTAVTCTAVTVYGTVGIPITYPNLAGKPSASLTPAWPKPMSTRNSKSSTEKSPFPTFPSRLCYSSPTYSNSSTTSCATFKTLTDTLSFLVSYPAFWRRSHQPPIFSVKLPRCVSPLDPSTTQMPSPTLLRTGPVNVTVVHQYARSTLTLPPSQPLRSSSIAMNDDDGGTQARDFT